jgi:hypothetical protein
MKIRSILTLRLLADVARVVCRDVYFAFGRQMGESKV